MTQYMAPSTAYGFDHSIENYNRGDKIGLNDSPYPPREGTHLIIWLSTFEYMRLNLRATTNW